MAMASRPFNPPRGVTWISGRKARESGLRQLGRGPSGADLQQHGGERRVGGVPQTLPSSIYAAPRLGEGSRVFVVFSWEVNLLPFFGGRVPLLK